MTLRSSATEEKDGRGFAADANRPPFDAKKTPARRRLLVVVPGSWPLDAARTLREDIEDLGHSVSMLRTDDMMRMNDVEEAIPNKDIIFLYVSDKRLVTRAQELAKELAITLHAAEGVAYGQVVRHIQVHA